MLPFTSHSDPGDEDQLSLEVPGERVCSCGAKRIQDCTYNANRWGPDAKLGTRPRDCLHRPQPLQPHEPLPYA